VMLVVILQKVFDIAYVPPIDVPTGTRTENSKMKRRYWTVFTPNAFSEVPQPPSKGGWAYRLRKLRSSLARK